MSDAKHIEYDRKWAALLSAPTSLDHHSTEILAGQFYTGVVKRHEREPGAPTAWRMRRMWDQLDSYLMPRQYIARPVASLPNPRLRREVRAFLLAKGINLDPASHHRFLIAAQRVSLSAAERLERIASFDFSGAETLPIDPNVARFPVADLKRDPINRFDRLFERFSKEARYPERTHRSWKSRVARFMAFSEREYPADVTRQDAVRFKDHLSEQKLDPEATIRNGHLAAVRAFMNWCIANEVGPEFDPIKGIRIYPDKNKSKARPVKGYTDEEASAILAAALLPAPSRINPTAAAARRWIPWICATTGARVSEVAQLRKQDVTLSTWSRRQRNQIPLIRFTLEAGPQKVFERDVPVHPDLVSLGFLDFVASAPGERLFVDPARARRRRDVLGLTASAGSSIARWIGTIVGLERKVQPNHAWRHRFNDLCNEACVHPQFRDIITGHVPATVGETYGNVHPAVLLHWMRTMDSHLELVRELNPGLANLLPPARAGVGEGTGSGPRNATWRPLPGIHHGGTPEVIEDGIFFELPKA